MPTTSSAVPDASSRALELTARADGLKRLFDLDGYERAVPLLREALELSPRCAEAHALLGETYAYWGFRREVAGEDEAADLYAMSLAHAVQGARLAPGSAPCRRALALSLRRGVQADPPRRLREAEAARELGPLDAECWWELWRAGGYDPDDPALLTALELGGDLCGLRVDLGALYAALGLHEEALTELMTALRLNPRNTLAAYDAAMVLDRMGERERAARLLRKALASRPADPLLQGGLGILGERP